MRHAFRRPLWLLLGLLLAGCAGAGAPSGTGASRQTTGSIVDSVSREDEERMGARLHQRMPQAFGGLSDNQRLNAYVGRVGARLAEGANPAINYRFFVLRNDTVNAFSLPGGYVYVTRGILALAASEGQLAAVLAHEMAHVERRHALRRYERTQQARRETAANIFSYGTGAGERERRALSAYAQRQEFEADTEGIRILDSARYDPASLARFLARLQREQRLRDQIAFRSEEAQRFDIYSTHPPTEARVREATRQAEALGSPNRWVGRDDHLAAVRGMYVDGDPANGFIRRRNFIHPQLRFRITAPEGFVLFNLPDTVLAVDREKNLMRLDVRRVEPGTGTLQYLTRDWAGRTRLSAVQRLDISGMEAATAIARGESETGPKIIRLVVIRFDPTTIYRIMYASHPRQFERMDSLFEQSARSFRRMSTAEARRVEPLRLTIYRTRPGDTLGSLAARMPYDHHRLERFLVLNNLREGDRLQAGVRVKLVAE